jgi:hypothetical protein
VARTLGTNRTGADADAATLLTSEGHGLFLVQHLASQRGYQRDATGTTLWFHLSAAYEPQQNGGQPGPDTAIPAQPDTFGPRAPGISGTKPYRARPTHLWAAAASPATAPA